MSMMKQLKRNAVIHQLNKLGIHSIEGQPLEDVLYSTLLKTLALKRAAQS